MSIDNSWFERGVLPTVGTECEMMLDGSLERVLIVGSSRDGKFVVQYRYGFIETEDCTFSPIRTERDELIELISRGSLKLNNIDTIAEAILAAGFTKQ